MSVVEPKAPQADCENCSLKDAPFAKTTGPIGDAKIAVVSRSPGKQEALQGRSFSGQSGKVLDHLLHLYGTNREEVVATNVVLCHCDEVPPDAINACSNRLQHEIRGCTTVIAAGVEAAKALAGVSNVHQNRGYVHQYGSNGGRLIITNNPAVALREERSYPDLIRDFRLALAPRPKYDLPTVRWTDDRDEAIRWSSDIYKSLQSERGSILGVDIETRGKDGRSGLERNAEIVCLGISQRVNRAVTFGESICYDRPFFDTYIKRILELDNIRYQFHNGKFDAMILRNHGVKQRVDEDTLLLSWALDERPGDPSKGWTGHSLEYLLKEYLGFPRYEPPSVGHFKKTGEFLEGDKSRHELYVYNGTDAAGGVGLYEQLSDAAKLDGVYEWPYRNHLLALNEAILRIESHGWPFDSELACDMLEEILWPRIKELEAQAKYLSGHTELNLNSSQQLANLYYDEWGLVHRLRRPKIENKGKRSSDQFVRKEILENRYTSKFDPFTVKEFTKVYDRHSTLDTQRGTFFEGLVKKQWPDGKLYYKLNIHGTETGRLSGNDPNLLNITRPKDDLPPVRDCFIAEPGHVILNCDLSQAELRAIAQLSGDENMRAIYLDSTRSLHKEVAAKFFGEGYNKEQYVVAKNINFGVVYLQSAFTFHQMYQLDQNEAQRYIDEWWEQFPAIQKWVLGIARQALSTGEVQSPFGHKRRFFLITSQNKEHIIREAVNFLPQNIAANLTLAAMIKVCENIDWDIAQPKVSVYDSLVLHVKTSHIEEVAHYVLDVMEETPKRLFGWDVPFKAEASFGPNWGRTDTEIRRD